MHTAIAADINNFPTLTTERLVLRKLNASDVGQLTKLRSDAQVNKYLDRPSTCTKKDAEAFISKINGFVDGGLSYYWGDNLKRGWGFDRYDMLLQYLFR